MYNHVRIGAFPRNAVLPAFFLYIFLCVIINFQIQMFTGVFIQRVYYGYVILYHKSNLVYTGLFPQFLIFQQNNSVQASVLILFTSRYALLFC